MILVLIFVAVMFTTCVGIVLLAGEEQDKLAEEYREMLEERRRRK